MKYQQSGEEEVDLEAEFDVTTGDDEVVLELFGGSNVAEYHSLTLEEAKHLVRGLERAIDRIQSKEDYSCKICGEPGGH